MLPHYLLVRRNVDAINLVLDYVAVQPLDLRSELVQNSAGLLLDGDHLFRRYISDVRNVAFDEVFRHRCFLATVFRITKKSIDDCRGGGRK